MTSPARVSCSTRSGSCSVGGGAGVFVVGTGAEAAAEFAVCATVGASSMPMAFLSAEASRSAFVGRRSPGLNWGSVSMTVVAASSSETSSSRM
ncbi:Uncharacterised protein [Mycobacteroides abscessus subsp. abscessus]|nr:Uncharacterised protein [Mycobacteroides abscessus subsp. abscessus]